MVVASSEGVRDPGCFSAPTSSTSSLLFEDTESPKSQTSRAGRVLEVSVLGRQSYIRQTDIRLRQTPQYLQTFGAQSPLQVSLGAPASQSEH